MEDFKEAALNYYVQQIKKGKNKEEIWDEIWKSYQISSESLK